MNDGAQKMARCGLGGPSLLGPNVYTEAPDGGWGWVVAVAFFVVEVFTYGTIKSFGIFLQDLIKEFGETNNRISWIVSICVFVMTFNAPLSSVMTNRFGFQLVVMTGGLLISSGTIATSFAGSVNQMYITYGLVAGLGYCLTFLPTVTILSQYFTRRRALVTALASTGESLSMFALAPAFSSLKERIGWRHTLAVIGALQSIIILSGATLRTIVIRPAAADGERAAGDSCSRESEPLCTEDGAEDKKPNGFTLNTNTSESPDNELNADSVNVSTEKTTPTEDTLHAERKAAQHCEGDESGGKCETETTDRTKDTPGSGKKSGQNRTKLLDFSILKEGSFILYSLFGLFATLGFFAPPLYIIQLSVNRGVKLDRAAYLLSTMAVAEILGRFSIGWILGRKPFRTKKLLVILGCVITMTLDLLGFTLVTEFYGLAVCCAFYGFFMGTLSCTHIPLLAEDDVVGIDRMSSAAGVYVFIQSFAGLAGPPLGGVLVDVTHNYGSAFYSCAAGMALSALFLGLVRPAKRGLLCWRRKPKPCEDTTEVKGDSEEKSADNKPDGFALSV